MIADGSRRSEWSWKLRSVCRKRSASSRPGASSSAGSWTTKLAIWNTIAAKALAAAAGAARLPGELGLVVHVGEVSLPSRSSQTVAAVPSRLARGG